MAPQPQTTEKAKITPEMIAAENAEARFGTEEDRAHERDHGEPLNQNAADGDPLSTGLERRTPIQRSPQDDMRSQIAKRFRRVESEAEERPFNGDLNDPENMYGIVAQNPADEDDSDDDLATLTGSTPEQIARLRRGQPGETLDDDDESLLDPVVQQPQRGQQPQQRTHKLKVNGQTIELTDDEVLARARKVTSADTYLEEAKALLREAKAIRAGRAAPHSGESDAETTDLGTDPPELEVQSPEPTTRSVIDKIQFADPDEAAAELDRLIDSRASKKATEGQLERVYKQDLARSQKQLKEFADANPVLGKNKVAALAIEQGMYDGYVEDMVALGLDEEQIPKGDVNALAKWHRFYRVNGFEVRSTKELLEASKKQFVSSLGELGVRQGQRQQPSRREQPRVQVTVDRDQRRMAIPQQPTRSVAPRRDALPNGRPQTGSDVVANMRRARGQVVV